MSSAVSPQWEIMMLGGSAVALAIVIICIRLWTNWARVRRARVGAAEPNTVEASRAYRRYLVAASCAGGSAQGWDHAVRPVLTDLAQSAFGGARVCADDSFKAARLHLGEQLWALVDPTGSCSSSGNPEIGECALTQILARLESPELTGL